MTFGATVISVQGSYEDTFELSKQAIDRWGWYNRNAAINPYLSEGKKTVSLEIAEQLNWKMPDYLAISVGDGCTIAGTWKGLKDLYAIGFIDKLPRLISCQAEGCCPLNRAIAEDKPWHPMEENTLADSIAVGVPRNADKALMAIRESNGLVVNVSDAEIMAAQKLLGTHLRRFRRARRRHRHRRREEALRAGRAGEGRHRGLRRHRQRPQGCGQRHQGLRRAHLHPLRHGFSSVWHIWATRCLNCWFALGSAPMERLPGRDCTAQPSVWFARSLRPSAPRPFCPLLTEEETDAFRRGRNAQVRSVPAHASRAQYSEATALEALFGWLYLRGQKARINQLFCEMMKVED
jgi:hypothetical protein